MECPAVFKKGTRTAILVDIGRKNLQYIPMGEGEFSIKYMPIRDFEKEYSPFDYDVMEAAAKYLEYSKYHGITERAQSVLVSLAGERKRSNTMAEAKKSTPAKKPEAKKPEAKKPETKKEAPAKKSTAPSKKAETKKEAPKKAAPAEGARGRKGAFSPEMKIAVKVSENPKRGTAAGRFDLYAKNNTVEKYLAAGGLMADIRWDVKQGFITVG